MIDVVAGEVMDSCWDAENARVDADFGVAVATDTVVAVAVVDKPWLRFMVDGVEWIHFFVNDENGAFFVNTATGLKALHDPRGEPATAPIRRAEAEAQRRVAEAEAEALEQQRRETEAFQRRMRQQFADALDWDQHKRSLLVERMEAEILLQQQELASFERPSAVTGTKGRAKFDRAKGHRRK